MPKEARRAPESLSVWESNMKELRFRQPALAKLLYDYVEEHGHAFDHFENVTPAGKWIEGLTDEPFFERDKEPKFNWSKKKREDRNKPVFMLYGVGTPPFLFKAIRELPAGAMAFIVFEPNIGLLAYTLHLTHVYLALPERCHLAFLVETDSGDERDEDVTESEKGLRGECLNHTLLWAGFYASSLSELSAHEGESAVYRDRFSRMMSGLKEWLNVRLMMLGNSAEDTLLGFRQIALMAPQIIFGLPLEALKGKYPGRPLVAVAAGPSLDKNFTLLKDIQDKCVIAASDAVLEKLLQNGIKPHIVTSLERGLPTYDLFYAELVEKYEEECRDILLVVQALCVPWVSGRWPGSVCVVYKQEVRLDQWFAGSMLKCSPLHSGMSVAHMCYSLGQYVGASEIAIIGQDLAYGDDGSSHAGSVVVAANADRSGAPEIPGALGGMVKTSQIWLAFLRYLEDLIKITGVPTYDCTEGGALIAGTTVENFADFIAGHISDLEPMEKTPAQWVAESDGDSGARAGKTLEIISAQYAQFDALDADLDELDALIGQTAAAGLEPARRIFYASRAGAVIDKIHARNPVFDFIGQSYTRHALTELSMTRSLDDVDAVRRWERLHREIADSHRANVTFVRKWLEYTESAIKYWQGKGNYEFGPIGGEDARERVEKIFEAMPGAENEAVPGLKFELNNILSRCDPIRLKWPGRMLWNCSAVLMLEGRSELATRFMDAAADDFDEQEMPVQEITAFFKDYARVLMEPDLCHFGNFIKAEMMVANAAGMCGEGDPEILEIIDRLNELEVSHMTLVDEIYKLKGEYSMALWYKAHSEAQRALYGGDLKRVLKVVWRAVSMRWKAQPGFAASHLDWLVKTVEKLDGVTDEKLARVVDEVLTGIMRSGNLMATLNVPFTPTLLQMLQARGYSINVMPAAEEKEQEAETETEAEAVEAGA